MAVILMCDNPTVSIYISLSNSTMKRLYIMVYDNTILHTINVIDERYSSNYKTEVTHLAPTDKPCRVCLIYEFRTEKKHFIEKPFDSMSSTN